MQAANAPMPLRAILYPSYAHQRGLLLARVRRTQERQQCASACNNLPPFCSAKGTGTSESSQDTGAAEMRLLKHPCLCGERNNQDK